ncbi:DNA sulfur modification protein DndB [Paenibacillus sp. FSL R5-0517]|uniref:DNA sulfur modification protein DndB n=1 Tax=Paenibacillus sp. FSL R5-0517 TaxID=2921647 RepID=UPI0030DB37D4
MKIEREQIEQRIANALKEIKHSRRKLYELNKILAEYRVPFGLLQSIIQDENTLKETEFQYLIGLTRGLHDLLNHKELEPSSLFGEREIRDSEHALNNEDDKLSLPLTFIDTLEIKFDSYLTKISIQKLVEMVSSQLIVYEEETQRGVVYKENKSGGIVKTPIVNRASVRRIASKMAGNQYFEDMITLNVYSTEVDPVAYHDGSRTLTINEGAVISILDGFHRLQGAVAALQMNPNAELNEILSIRVYDDETAKKFFSQLNTINVLKKERRKELAQERLSDKVVSDLQQKSEIGKQIASSNAISELAGELTIFDIMTYAIDKVYHLERQLDVIKTSKYLNEFFAYLVGNYPDEFSTDIKQRKNRTKSHPLMFIGYIVLSKYMLSNNINLEEIEKYVDRIDYEDDELISLLNDKIILTGNKRVRDKLISYFSRLFEEVAANE